MRLPWNFNKQAEVAEQENPPGCTEHEYATCSEEEHSWTWPCDYAPGTGRLAEGRAR